MLRANKLLLVVLFVSIVWPPVFFFFIAENIRPTMLGRGEMRDYEIQKLLNANRWVIDIPPEKDGWFLDLACKNGDKRYASGGFSVVGGSTIILLTRRNTFDDRIEYAWYQSTKTRQVIGPLILTFTTSGTGSFADPLANATETSNHSDGTVAIGDCLYRGSTNGLQFPNGPADFEVRVELRPPANTGQN